MKCFYFFFSDCKHFSNPTFSVHNSMEYLASTNQILKSDFFPLDKVPVKKSNWAVMNPQKEIEGSKELLPNLLLLFNFD